MFKGVAMKTLKEYIVSKFYESMSVKSFSLMIKPHERYATTHSAPQGEKSNFMIPAAFPAFCGQLKIEIHHTFGMPISYSMNGRRHDFRMENPLHLLEPKIHLGTGTGHFSESHQGFLWTSQYQVTLWRSDWPGLPWKTVELGYTK
jgi:hypothetical protein